MQKPAETVDPEEIAKFSAMAAEWWDPRGKFRPLHKFNPVRLDYIRREVCHFKGLMRQARHPLPASTYWILAAAAVCSPSPCVGWVPLLPEPMPAKKT